MGGTLFIVGREADRGDRADTASWPLHDTAGCRKLETDAAHDLPPQALMQRAGIAVGRLALALAPHAERIWILAGPGNNGGDGLEAALFLHAAGRRVTVGLPTPPPGPTDAGVALARARAAGVAVVEAVTPPTPLGRDDLAIDALFGLGLSRAPQGPAARAIGLLNAGAAPVLAVDLPSGLAADSGQAFDAAIVARWTLSLLALKPGLFTAVGRDHAGDVWFDDLGVAAAEASSVARLVTGQPVDWPRRRHASHKGTHGDVWIVGGAPGMGGAAVLAARAASAAGAGRVLLAGLDAAAPTVDPVHPELMHRAITVLQDRGVGLESSTLVCGCGGGDAIAALLPNLIARAGRLLLDADALNALAADATLAQRVVARGRRDRPTLLTPHPLEAARLLGVDTSAVQADRLQAARALATRLSATVVLKGSGSVIASPGRPTGVNAAGNASLANAGTGDVLAGWIGGLWSQGMSGDDAAALGVHTHARAADLWRSARQADGPLEASRLIDRLRDLRA